MLKEIFSGKCPACKGNSKLNEPLCETCLSKVLRFEYFCGACGYPLEELGKSCDRCERMVCKNIDNVYAIYRYNQVIRGLILAIKFRYNIRSSLTLSKIICTTAIDFSSYDAIVPVPSHFLRKFMRFYHPTDLIVKYIKSNYDAPIRKVISRNKYTDFQFKLNKKERAKNISNAFTIKSDVTFKNVLIVDDILTTGSTISECAKLLRQHGAEKIDCLVLAKD